MLCFSALCLTTSYNSNGAAFIPNITLVNLWITGNFFWSRKRQRRNLNIDLSSSFIWNWRYISEILPTVATGYLWNLNNTLAKYFCNFGPWHMILFRLVPSWAAEASNIILAFVCFFIWFDDYKVRKEPFFVFSPRIFLQNFNITFVDITVNNLVVLIRNFIIP